MEKVKILEPFEYIRNETPAEFEEEENERWADRIDGAGMYIGGGLGTLHAAGSYPRFQCHREKTGGIKNMIKIETEKDGKINAAICGAPDEILPEFFSLLHHIAKICMHNCKDGQHEEFAAALKFEIDKTYMEAIKEAIKTAKRMGD